MAIDVARFFQSIWAQIAVVEGAAGEISERWFKIADCTVRVRFIGLSLFEIIVPALSHLEVAPSTFDADITIHCWDCASLGMEFPEAPVTVEAFNPRGDVQGLNDARFHTAFEAGGRLLSLMDAHLREAVYCIGDGAEIPRYVIAEPIRGILSWFMRENGRQLLHAGAVGTPDGGVLLFGRSGAGKSNTALGCLEFELALCVRRFLRRVYRRKSHRL